jgi:THO complex subunit 4
MSANVDKSLDTIIGERKTNRKHLAGRRNRKASSKATIAPVGGVKKPTKQKTVTKAVPTGPSGAARSSKIVVSGLVSEVFCRAFLYETTDFF